MKSKLGILPQFLKPNDMQEINYDWLRESIVPHLINYQINYRFYPTGDFGALNQVSIESKEKGCEIDFWDSGRISIYLWDYQKEKVLLNKLLFPEQETEKQEAFEELLTLL